MKRMLIVPGVICSINMGAQDITISGKVTEGDTDRLSYSMAGIINIIYKKEKEEGFNGDVGSFSANSKYITAPGTGHKISKKGLNNAD